MSARAAAVTGLATAFAFAFAGATAVLLYIGTGDGGGANDLHGSAGNAQDLGSLLGKVLRIDPRASGRRAYTIPRSNPFVGRAGARGEIYSWGARTSAGGRGRGAGATSTSPRAAPSSP